MILTPSNVMIALPQSSVFLKQALLFFTAIGSFGAVYLALRFDIPWLVQDIKVKDAPWYERIRFGGWALMFLGLAATGYVIGKILLHTPTLPITADVIVYGAGATAIMLGVCIIAINYAKGGRRHGPLPDQQD